MTARNPFHIWATGDAHVGTDLNRGRSSLAEAIIQSELGGEDGGPPFDWDVMLDVGDMSGNQMQPDDKEGREVVRQYGVLEKHTREQIYNVVGNHDATWTGDTPQWWFRKWVDPLGENTDCSGVDSSKRAFKVEGTWERYKFQAGNVLVLMMGDRNDGDRPAGRGNVRPGKSGGYPAGAVTGETFDWWVEQVESNQDKIIISAHHHMLKETTVASGPWEGFDGRDRHGRYKGVYHGYFKDGGPMGASYLYFVDGNPDAQAFERYLKKNPGVIDMWIGGHTHTNPDDTHGGRSHIERKWDVTFLNCCALTRYHGEAKSMPMSRLLSLGEGDDTARIRCYLHTSEYAPQGWYDKAERAVPLRRPFVM